MSRLLVMGIVLGVGLFQEIGVVAMTQHPPKEESLVVLQGSDLKNRSYYYIEKDYECTPYALEARKFKTFKDRIDFSPNKVTFRGDGCSDMVRTESYNPDDFRFTRDLSKMRFKGVWYEMYAKPPEL